MTDRETRLDRLWLRASFDRAAPHYDGAADLQREVAESLLQRLDLIRLTPRRVVDVGAGTGYCSRALSRRYRAASVIALDISPAMLQQARRQAPRLFSRERFVCSDAQSLALASGSCDLVFSSLALQWCEQLDRTLEEFWRVCAPDGLVLFATFGPDTLRELRESWSAADQATHVNHFHDLHVIGDALVRAGFQHVVMDVERLTRRYPDVTTLMRHLKTLGAHNVTTTRPRHLLGRGVLERVARAYEVYRQDGALPATYEVVFGHAWKAPTSAPVAVRFSPFGPEPTPPVR